MLFNKCIKVPTDHVYYILMNIYPENYTTMETT